MLLSIIGQFFLHLAALSLALRLADSVAAAAAAGEATTAAVAGGTAVGGLEAAATVAGAGIAAATGSIELAVPGGGGGGDDDGEFEPGVVNSVIFLVATVAQAATFGVNYRGRPFMAGLAENRLLLGVLAVQLAVCLLAAAGVSPAALEEALQLVPLPSAGDRAALVALLLADAAAAWAWELTLRAVFRGRL